MPNTLAVCPIQVDDGYLSDAGVDHHVRTRAGSLKHCFEALTGARVDTDQIYADRSTFRLGTHLGMRLYRADDGALSRLYWSGGSGPPLSPKSRRLSGFFRDIF